MNIKTGDKVRVISGKDKGEEGTVTKIISDKTSVVIDGVNMIKKAQKASQSNPKGGIVEVEAPIHVSNVMLIDPSSSQPTRVGYRVENDTKVRYAKKSGETIDK